MKRVFLFVIFFLSVSSGYGGEQPVSPAQQKIAWAEKAIETNPKNFQAHNDLALALTRRARETSDAVYYDRAEEALRESFRLSPDNFEGRKTLVWVFLGKHEFARALEEATALNRQMPDDIQVYGFLVDANAELGNYTEAEKAAQWMLDMRPGNIPGLTRAAYLREIFGDIDGAVELLDAAYQRTSPTEIEDRAWVLTHIAHLQLMAGRAENAENLLTVALALFPRYHYALGNLAQVRLVQKRYPAAVDLLRQRYEAAPHPENLYALAEALKLAGRANEAKTTFIEFEKKARAEMLKADNSNRELVFYYADRAKRPAEALRVAMAEMARRRDVYTVDAYAWALHKNGRHAEALRQIETALAVGIRDAKILYHAGAIAAKLGDRVAAVRYLRQSLDLSPRAVTAADTRKILARMKTRL